MSMLDDFLNALSSQESGGNYGAVNQHTGALGRWQVLPGNVTPWAKRYLGINMTADQFHRSPALQDKLVRAVLGSYVSKYGYRGAASAWYSGNPNLENNYNKQRYGPSIGGYVDSVMGKMGKPGSLSSVMSGIADSVKLATTNVAQSLPGMKQDPLQIAQGLVPNQQAADRKEPAAVKGLGLSIEDGIGAGQMGMNTPFGLDNPSDLADASAGAELVQTETRPRGAGAGNAGQQAAFDALSGFDSILGGGASHGKYTYFNPVPGYRPSGTWNGRANINIGGRHKALDFSAPTGTSVHAPMDGTVVFAGWDPNGSKTNGGFGLSVRIRNADGSYVILGHLSSIGTLKVGQQVRGNQSIAKVGSTGNSTGSHLHMEFRHSAWDPNSAFDFTSLFKW